MEFRKKCRICEKYLMALPGKDRAIFCHPASPCSGTTDAINLVVEVEDESLQEIWEKEYGYPLTTDYELLNKIWDNRLLRFLIERFVKK